MENKDTAPYTLYGVTTNKDVERDIDSNLRALYIKESDALLNINKNKHSIKTKKFRQVIVYSAINQLPKEVEIHNNQKDVVEEVALLNSNIVYALIRNTDVTEGRGNPIIFLFVTGMSLAQILAKGNSVSGSSCRILPVKLNTYPIERKEMRCFRDLNFPKVERIPSSCSDCYS